MKKLRFKTQWELFTGKLQWNFYFWLKYWRNTRACCLYIKVNYYFYRLQMEMTPFPVHVNSVWTTSDLVSVFLVPGFQTESCLFGFKWKRKLFSCELSTRCLRHIFKAAAPVSVLMSSSVWTNASVRQYANELDKHVRIYTIIKSQTLKLILQ